MEIRNDGHMDAASKRGKGFSSRIRSSRCSRYRVTRVKYGGRGGGRKKGEFEEEGKERERGAATKVGRRVIATFCHLDGDRTFGRT